MVCGDIWIFVENTLMVSGDRGVLEQLVDYNDGVQCSAKLGA